MTGTVPLLSIVFMAVSALLAFLLPIALLLFLRKKKGADILPFFVGCAVMLLFAFVLESLMHQLILSSPAGAVIQGKLLLYALYGSFMAGLFEETGRFVAFGTVLKKRLDKDANALMYGAGHGGFEAMFLLGVSMINNIAYSLMINSGTMQASLSLLSGEALEQMNVAVASLISTQPAMFLVGIIERIFAIILQISLSVIVWFAAKDRKKIFLFPLAILIHMAVDFVAVMLSGVGCPVLLTEAVIGLMAFLAALYARSLLKKSSAS